MALLFLDANIFLRYLTQDDPGRGQRAYAILQQVEDGTLQAVTFDRDFDKIPGITRQEP